MILTGDLALDFAFPLSTMGRKRHVPTAHWNIAQQWSVQITEERRSSRKPSVPYCPHVQYLHQDTHTHTRQHPARAPHRMSTRIWLPRACWNYDRVPTSISVASCTGTKYTVAVQDTCQSISTAKSIALDWLIASNGLDYNCSSLTLGTTLCLGPSCALQTITKGQTCQDITGNKKFTSVQLISWNP